MEYFGFAAFGLTVIPYTTMFLINLLENIMRPSYAAIFLVKTKSMYAAKAAGATIEGAFGTLDEEDQAQVRDRNIRDPLEQSSSHIVRQISRKTREQIRQQGRQQFELMPMMLLQMPFMILFGGFSIGMNYYFSHFHK